MKGRAIVLAAVLVCLPAGARGEERDTPCVDGGETPRAVEAGTEPKRPAPPALGELVVKAERPVSAASSFDFPARTFDLQPHDTPFQLLNDLPGVVVSQHQGGGKAPQYLVRGFDADHGTDFGVYLDGRPVNLPTHAHGQGYADTNFLIPETLDTVQLYKGPYFVQLGDFVNAGAVNFVTKDAFPKNFLLAEGGSFATQRYVLGASQQLGPVKALLATQYYFSDGPFDHPEGFTKYNLFAKLTAEPNPNGRLWLSTTIYDGTWSGSGQIPLRAVSTGQLDRFGAVDPTEGGRTDQEDVDLHYDWRPTPRDVWESQMYGFRYKLALFSDFTFFKDTGLRFIQQPDGSVVDTRDVGPPVRGADYVPGDGIEQNDQRWVYGAKGRWTHTWEILGLPISNQLGVETRNDEIHVALHRQVERQRFFTVNQLAVAERSVSSYLQEEIFLREWARLEVGFRSDVYFLDGSNRLPDQAPDPDFTPVAIKGHTSDQRLSPKANLILTPVPDTDVYLNFGEGFHSNDARNALLASAAGSSFSPLTRSIGYELGARTRQLDGRFQGSAALWRLDLDSELVFNGDAGNQEVGAGGTFQPEGRSRRWGVDADGTYRLLRFLTADMSLAYANPEFLNGEAIPLAPTLLIDGGLTFEHPSGFSAGLRTRFLDDRPANPERTLVARGYTLLDLLLRYRWRNVLASLSFYNLTDRDWREAQFADNTCLRSEIGRVPGCLARPGQQGTHPDPPADIHFTPGNPFSVVAGLTLFF